MDPNTAGLAGITFVLVLATLGVVLLTVVIWQLFVTWRARAALAREDEYRKLAERSIATQEQIAQELARAVEGLSDVRGRVTEMERMLKEVG